MCGITGIFNSSGEPVSSVILKKMTDSIAHRGPDGEGFYVDSFLGLGHRRLAIIDLSPAGHQPMITPDGHYVLAYNGEIYNFNTLRLELEALGCHFRSQTDSEVVLHAYAQWGLDAIKRFNGMFAFALWDKRKQELILARDRYGIKPLYYMQAQGRFLFGSEIKAILAHPDCVKSVDKAGLLEYMAFQNFFTDKTLFNGISMLPAGSFLRVKLSDDSHPPCPERFWDYHFSEPETILDEREYLEELDRLFQQAVNRQMMSDVPVGSYLSGGMDSGSVSAIAARQYPELRTFTVGFDLHSASGMELAFDERSKAEHMSYLFKTEHYEMVLKAGDMERVLPRMAWHIEEPRVGQSYPNFYAAQLASKFVKVALSGTGGDEMFGGYPWRYYRAVVNDNFDHYIAKYYQFWQRMIPQAEMEKVFKPIAADIAGISPLDIFRNVFSSHAAEFTRPEDYINHSMYLEAKTFLHGLLVVEDKLSMAHGLETRVPFLDNDLADFAMQIPTRLRLGNLAEVLRLNENEPGPKTRRFFERTKDGKLLLRKMMARHIPEEVTNREKQGFSAPDASWFKGESIDYVKRVLYNPNACIFEYLDRETLLNLVNDHLDGRENRRLLIWSLLSLENWFKRFMS